MQRYLNLNSFWETESFLESSMCYSIDWLSNPLRFKSLGFF